MLFVGTAVRSNGSSARWSEKCSDCSKRKGDFFIKENLFGATNLISQEIVGVALIEDEEAAVGLDRHDLLVTAGVLIAMRPEVTRSRTRTSEIRLFHKKTTKFSGSLAYVRNFLYFCSRKSFDDGYNRSENRKSDPASGR